MQNEKQDFSILQCHGKFILWENGVLVLSEILCVGGVGLKETWDYTKRCSPMLFGGTVIGDSCAVIIRQERLP